MPTSLQQAELTTLIEKHVLHGITNNITIAFDEVDRILGQKYQRDFFAMIRMWHNRRAIPRSLWAKLDIALVISTEPYSLIDTADQSPFNVGPLVALKNFDFLNLLTLNRAYGDLLSDSDLSKLHEYLGGHPFLTRLAFYRLARGGSSDVQTLLVDGAHLDGPFSDHLKGISLKLHQEGLLDTMKAIGAGRHDFRHSLLDLLQLLTLELHGYG